MSAMENKFVGYREHESYRGGTEIQIFKRWVLDPCGELAIRLIEHWGILTGTPDGEDSAGRAKARLQTVDELVMRACDTADAMLTAIEQRGWMVQLPDPKAQKPEEKKATANA